MDKTLDKGRKHTSEPQSQQKKRYVRPELVKRQILPQVTQGSAHQS